MTEAISQQVSPNAPLTNQNENQIQQVGIAATNNQNFSGANASALSSLKSKSEVVTCPNCGFVGNSMVTTK